MKYQPISTTFLYLITIQRRKSGPSVHKTMKYATFGYDKHPPFTD